MDENLCLLVKTVDNRHFFTEIGNFPPLIEFAKGQNAEISVVKLQEEAEIMTLPVLARSFCDPAYKLSEVKYEVIETKLSMLDESGKMPRQKVLAQAQEIRTYIETSLLKKNIVSLIDLTEKFRSYNLSEAALRKHLTYVRLHLAKNGYEINKIGVGAYQLSTF